MSGKEIEMEKDVSETDKYGRLLRYIYVDGIMINEVLVKEGYAKVATYPPDVKNKDLFLSAEQEARNNNNGLWGRSCTCNKDIINTTCTSCNKSAVTKQNYDCTTYEETQVDNSCSYLCTAPKPVVTTPPVVKASKYSCSCSKTCEQMSSCEEAYYQMDTCCCAKRDGDSDGIPCESICN